MWPRIILALGVLVIGLTLAAWWLLSGFGCEMNTAGCRTVRLDWSWDMVSLFLPTFVIGTVLIATGLWKMR
ncbi:hypothetical protein BH10PSE8_BH10PSE8_12560 [soil metagenome]|jgi:hypothetical protein